MCLRGVKQSQTFWVGGSKAVGYKENSESFGREGSPALPLESNDAVWPLVNVSGFGSCCPWPCLATSSLSSLSFLFFLFPSKVLTLL